MNTMHCMYSVKIIGKFNLCRWAERRAGIWKHSYWIVWMDNLKEKDHFVDLNLGPRILDWVLKYRMGGAWTGLIWLRIGTSSVDNEPLGSIKCDEFFFDQLSNC